MPGMTPLVGVMGLSVACLGSIADAFLTPQPFAIAPLRSAPLCSQPLSPPLGTSLLAESWGNGANWRAGVMRGKLLRKERGWVRMCAPESTGSQASPSGAGISGGSASGARQVPEEIYIKAQELSNAVRVEEYARAAELRDEVKELREMDHLSFLLEELREAVAEEEFEKASNLKVELATELAQRSKDTLNSRLQGRGRGRVRVNRLLVLTNEADLLTCSPDGSARVDITGEAGSLGFGVEGRTGKFLQPTWSPSGDLVAATVIDPQQQGQERGKTSQVMIMWAQDGSAMSQVTAPFVPFYYFWSHDSTRLSYLTTYADGPGQDWQVSLDLIRVLQDPDAKKSIYDVSMTHLEDGVPLFYSQCPRDKRMLVHVGDKRKIFVTEPAALGAEELVLSTRPGNFRAPQWLSRQSNLNSELVVFVEETPDGKGQEVVVSDARGGSGPRARRSLTEVSGFSSLTVSPDGQRMALLTRRKKELEEELCILEGPFDLEDDPWPVDLEPIEAYTNQKQDLTASRRRVLGFFWSPDGRKLLYLTVPEKDDILASGGSPVDIHWEVVDVVTRGHWVFERHIPSHAFLSQFLPFFDQYAQSQSLWSPDSDKFCYAGQGADGQSIGAWVQEVPGKNEDVPPPRLVVSGAQVVSWSPC